MQSYLHRARGTFGEIWINGHVLHHIRILVEDGYLISSDVLVHITDEEGIILLNELDLILLDVLLSNYEDLSREVEPLLVGLNEVDLGGLRELLKLLLVVLNDHAQLVIVLFDVVDLQRVVAVLLAVLAR